MWQLKRALGTVTGSSLVLVGLPLVAFQIWISVGVPIVAWQAGYDDTLFLRLASELVNGNWLGDYQLTTLIKGPLYPMFIALGHRAGIPLTILQQLVYCAACILVVAAIRPLVRKEGYLAAGLALMLLNPYSWAILPMNFSRDALGAYLAILVTAGIAGVAVRRHSGRQLWPWAALVGASAAGSWLTREESVWILAPMGLLLAGVAGLQLWRGGEGRYARVLTMLVLPAALGIAPVLSVCEMNRRHYGAFCVVDIRTREFMDAYGALSRVGQEFYINSIPVPKAAREQMYAVSPSFAMLQPMLEGRVGNRWSDASRRSGEIAGGWFVWAFADAAMQVSGAKKGPPLALYRAIADEINAACDRGDLPAGPFRSSLTPAVHSEDYGAIVAALRRHLFSLVDWHRIQEGPGYSTAPSLILERAEQLAGGRIAPPLGKTEFSGWVWSPLGKVSFVQVAKGKALPIRAIIADSPDVKASLASEGIRGPGTDRCRFSFSLHPNRDELWVVAGGKRLLRFSDGMGRSVRQDNLLMYLDEFDPGYRPPVPRLKQKIINHSQVAYWWTAMLLTPISVLWLLVSMIWRRPGGWIWIVLFVSVVSAVCIRTALLAFIDATSFPVSAYRYFLPGYAMMSIAWCIALCGIAQWWSAGKSKSRTERESGREAQQVHVEPRA